MNARRIVRRVIAPTLVALCAALGIAFAVDNLPVAAWEDAPVKVERIEEDSPEWDCATMGNGLCGEEQDA